MLGKVLKAVGFGIHALPLSYATNSYAYIKLLDNLADCLSAYLYWNEQLKKYIQLTPYRLAYLY